MSDLKLGDNLLKFRHKNGLTQEEIASFIGVTKGSVSKWENKQSMPDITLLPALAALFDVTVDELLGYEAQLSKKQIEKIYANLTEQFVTKAYFDVYEDVKKYVHKYYNCYPLIVRMCVLLLNHYSLWETPDGQKSVLEQCKVWCNHVKDFCDDSDVIIEANSVYAYLDFCLGNYKDVIMQLKDMLSPTKMSNALPTLLVQALGMSGDIDNMDKYAQIFMFNSIDMILSFSITMLSAKSDDSKWCEETINRMDKLVEAYNVSSLNANIAVQYFYQAALYQIHCENKKSALNYIEKFVDTGIELLKFSKKINIGDDYFNRISEWFDEMPLGKNLPRDMKLISADLLAMINNPELDVLTKEKQFIKLKNRMETEVLLCQK